MAQTQAQAQEATALVIQPRIPPIFRTRLTEMLGIDHPIMVTQ